MNKRSPRRPKPKSPEELRELVISNFEARFLGYVATYRARREDIAKSNHATVLEIFDTQAAIIEAKATHLARHYGDRLLNIAKEALDPHLFVPVLQRPRVFEEWPLVGPYTPETALPLLAHNVNIGIERSGPPVLNLQHHFGSPLDIDPRVGSVDLVAFIRPWLKKLFGEKATLAIEQNTKATNVLPLLVPTEPEFPPIMPPKNGRLFFSWHATKGLQADSSRVRFQMTKALAAFQLDGQPDGQYFALLPCTQRELAVLYLARRDVLDDRERQAVAVDTGKPHTKLVEGLVAARGKEVRPLPGDRVELVSKTGDVQLSLPVVFDDESLQERLVHALRQFKEGEVIRHWVAFLRAFSIEGGRTGSVEWSLDDHLLALGYAAHTRQRLDVRKRVANLIELLSNLELAIYAPSGKLRDRAPLLHVERKQDRQADDGSWVMERMVYRINPWLYEGVRKANGELGENFSWVPPELAHSSHPYAPGLGLVLATRFRLARNEGEESVVLSGRSVLRAAGIQPSAREPGEAWETLTKTLDELHTKGAVGVWEWRNGTPGLDEMLELEPPHWLADRLYRGVAPVERKPVRSLTGSDLKAWRTKERLTQAQAAEKLGCSKRTVVRAEKGGESALSERVREALEQASKVTPEGRASGEK